MLRLQDRKFVKLQLQGCYLGLSACSLVLHSCKAAWLQGCMAAKL